MRAWINYEASRESVVFSGNPTFMGTMDAWAGYAYWPVRDAKGVLVGYARRDLGGLPSTDLTKSEACKWAMQALGGTDATIA